MAAHQKYTITVARTVAQRIYTKYGEHIANASGRWGVPQDYMAGLVGMENPQCWDWPDRRSYRLEKHILQKFRNVKSWNPKNFLNWSYNGVKYKHIKGLSDDALVNLSTSFGPTQIMAYYLLTIFEGRTVADLRDPKQHFLFTCEMMHDDPQLYRHLEARNFAQICHVWNSGRTWNGKQGWAKGGKGNIKTWSPYYMYNCALVRQEYLRILAAKGSPQAQKLVEQYGPDENEDLPRGSAVDENLAYDGEATGAEQFENFDLPDDAVAIDSPVEGQDEMTAASLDPGPAPEATASLEPKPGWQTSQGQLVGFLTGVSALLALVFGIKITPEAIQNTSNIILLLIPVFSPLAIVVPVLISYINSRGKVASNSFWAKAAVIGQAVAPNAGFESPDQREMRGQRGFAQLKHFQAQPVAQRLAERELGSRAREVYPADQGWTGLSGANPMADLMALRKSHYEMSARPLSDIYERLAPDSGIILTDKQILDLFEQQTETIRALHKEITDFVDRQQTEYTGPDAMPNEEEIRNLVENLEQTATHGEQAEDLLELTEE